MRFLDAYETTLHGSSCSWVKTTPMTMGPASATIRVLHLFLKQANVSSRVSRCFNFWKDLCWSFPNQLLIVSCKHSQWFKLAAWAKSDRNLTQYCTSDRKDLTSAVPCEGLAFWIATTFSLFISIAWRTLLYEFNHRPLGNILVAKCEDDRSITKIGKKNNSYCNRACSQHAMLHDYGS